MEKHDAVAESVGRGIIAAWRTYGAWSDNFYVHDEGIEAFLSVKIAESLHSHFADVCRVRLEVPFGQLLKSCGAKNCPSELSAGKRVDVAFYNKRQQLIGVVEVKRHFMPSHLRNDVARISSMLDAFGRDNGGSMKWGVVAAMHTIWSSNTKSTDERLAAATQALANTASKRRIKAVATTDWLDRPLRFDEDETELRGCAGMCLIVT